jgi:hypothetical protein
MYPNEYVVVFKYTEVVGYEPNPDFDKEAGLSFGNCPNRLVEKVEWICGVDGPDNLAITQQTSHATKSDAISRAEKLAKANGREKYVLQSE